MPASLPLEVADRLFPIAQGKNPWKMPPTHISQVLDWQAAEYGAKRAELLAHVRAWHEGPAWTTHPEHMNLDTYLRVVAGYPDLGSIREDIRWALRRVNGCQ